MGSGAMRSEQSMRSESQNNVMEEEGVGERGDGPTELTSHNFFIMLRPRPLNYEKVMTYHVVMHSCLASYREEVRGGKMRGGEGRAS